jgi:hypothetical protein
VGILLNRRHLIFSGVLLTFRGHPTYCAARIASSSIRVACRLTWLTMISRESSLLLRLTTRTLPEGRASFV